MSNKLTTACALATVLPPKQELTVDACAKADAKAVPYKKTLSSAWQGMSDFF